MQQIVGIFGGTFDPVHLGHIMALNQLSECIDFCRVHWVLSARPPHKNSVSTSIEQRFEMLTAALSEYSKYVPDDCEMIRREKSYTFDTIQHFRRRFPGQTLCLIIGGDSLRKLTTWHRYQELIDSVHIIVMARPGYRLVLPKILRRRLLTSYTDLHSANKASLMLFRQTDFDISSTQIRALIAEAWQTGKWQGGSDHLYAEKLAQWLPSKVIDIIGRQKMYIKRLVSEK